MSPEPALVEGPYFEDLEVDQHFVTAPGITLTEGGAAVHQACMGGRLRPALDRHLSERLLGAGRWLADPSYVWDVAIGQSTQPTQNVLANLFYRSLAFHRAPVLGDTLRTATRVVALRANRDRPGRNPTGLAVLQVTTHDQEERTVLDFWRCAMLPRRAEARDEHSTDVDVAVFGSDTPDEELVRATADWHWEALDEDRGARTVDALRPGLRYRVGDGDVVSSAPEVARMTTNLAAVHHDVGRAPGGRLVYGGHTIGIALAQATRALPGLLTVTAWHSCDHVSPVREGDTLRSTVEVEGVQQVQPGVARVDLRSLVTAETAPGDAPRQVLDWRFVAVTT